MYVVIYAYRSWSCSCLNTEECGFSHVTVCRNQTDSHKRLKESIYKKKGEVNQPFGNIIVRYQFYFDLVSAMKLTKESRPGQ